VGSPRPGGKEGRVTVEDCRSRRSSPAGSMQPEAPSNGEEAAEVPTLGRDSAVGLKSSLTGLLGHDLLVNRLLSATILRQSAGSGTVHRKSESTTRAHPPLRLSNLRHGWVVAACLAGFTRPKGATPLYSRLMAPSGHSSAASSQQSASSHASASIT